jgi:hypothetical protein
VPITLDAISAARWKSCPITGLELVVVNPPDSLTDGQRYQSRRGAGEEDAAVIRPWSLRPGCC